MFAPKICPVCNLPYNEVFDEFETGYKFYYHHTGKDLKCCLRRPDGTTETKEDKEAQ